MPSSNTVSQHATPLRIRFKKQNDGTHVFSCLRADGSATWQRDSNISPLHDLTHYAVETVLGHRQGFYGLVADGWDLGDFGSPWPRGRLPVDSDPSELIVGFFDLERATGSPMSADDFEHAKATYFAQHGVANRPWRLSEQVLHEIRDQCALLFERWRQISAGESLELEFPAGDRPGGAQ